MIEGFSVPESFAQVEVPYCYAVNIHEEQVYLERNSFFGRCDESKVRYVIVECKTGVKVYKNGALIRELPCERLRR